MTRPLRRRPLPPDLAPGRVHRRSCIPDVARVIAEKVLHGHGTYTAETVDLLVLFRERIPQSRAAASEAAAAMFVRRVRADLGTSYGIAVRRVSPGLGHPEWSFRLVAVPGEEAA